MNKKIIAIIIVIIMTSMSATTIALAQQETKSLCIGTKCVIPPYSPRQVYPDITLARGVAVDKNNLDTESVIFLIVKYNGETSMYLFINNDFYKMTEITNNNNWNTETRIFQYKSNDDSILTVVIQHFDSYGFVSVSGDFKNYIIAFEPIYKNGSRPMTTNQEGDILKEIPTYETISKKLNQRTGIVIDDILKSETQPIKEWVE
jgi:hypothetical protein